MNSEGGGNIRRQVILAYKRRAGEVAEEKRVDLGRGGVPVLQAFLPGFHGERAKVAAGKRPKWRLSDADYGDRSHIVSLSTTILGSAPVWLVGRAIQNFTLSSTQARRGAPGEKKVALCAGALPA